MKETANFNAIYIVNVPHQLEPVIMPFWSDDEIIGYASENAIDWDIENLQDAIDWLGSDVKDCFVIRNLEDCINAYKKARHQASEVREIICKIADDEGIENFESMI